MKLAPLRTALAALAFALSLPACAQTAPRAAATDSDPALWVVKDADTTVYLFGTIHILKPGLSWFDEAVKAAFDRSDEVKLEIVAPDPAAAQRIFATYGIAATGATLPERLPAKDRPALARAMASVDIAPADYAHMRPWLAATYLQVLSLGKIGYDPANGPEQVVAAAAKAAGKPVTGLETMDEQIRLIAGLSDRAQVTMLRSTLAELPTLSAGIDRLVGQWSHGRTEAIASELNKEFAASPEALAALLVARNRRWAGWIAERMKTPGTVFVAVGAGHLAGRDSVQAQLAKAGVKAARVRY